LRENAASDAIVWRDRIESAGALLERVLARRRTLDEVGARDGAVVSLRADFSPESIALLLAAVDARCIVVPLRDPSPEKLAEREETAGVELSIAIDPSTQELVFARREPPQRHELVGRLRAVGRPGLVLFSSGSTGKEKAALHDFVPLLEKFKTKKKTLRSIAFLLFDHIGGLNTLLYTLSNGGCVITVEDRSPDGVLAAVARHRAELLPTSPTFLNLVLLSEALRRHDTSSLKLVTYGTEPMPESTLRRLHEELPRVELQQTYGLSEIGILRSKSRGPDSLWVKIGGEGIETRIRDGLLEVKSPSAMLGYLNAASPFTEDGWFQTGDAVEQEGEYFRILGRRSEIVNVGGQKVYPAEVESVLLEARNVAEATVFGEKNPITGSIVCARVRLRDPEDPKAAIARLREHARARLERWKVPVKLSIDDERQHNDRWKKMRPKSQP
jgi:acyl-coenzyme A synthetase/AMP-(fatty) acid ligase